MAVMTFQEKILSPTEARSQFSRVLSDVRAGTPVIIHQPKHEDVTLVPRVFLSHLLQEMENLSMQIESLELALDERAKDAIRRSEEDVKAGRTVSLRDAVQILKEQRQRRGNR